MRGRLVALAMACWVAASAGLLAQAPSEDVSDSRTAGSYLKVGLAHWQGDIFSEGRLTHRNVDLFGANYNLTSVNMVFDTYWSDTFLQLSGFSLGYRKDVIRHLQSGHMFNGALFRVIDLKVVELKAGVGIEWGMPSLNFDQTEDEFASDGTTRSRHTSPQKRRRALHRHNDGRGAVSVYRVERHSAAWAVSGRGRPTDQQNRVPLRRLRSEPCGRGDGRV